MLHFPLAPASHEALELPCGLRSFVPVAPKRRQTLEHTEQSRFFAILRRLKHPAAQWAFAIPNGFLLDKGLRIKAWREGATSGVWDVFVPWPTPEGPTGSKGHEGHIGSKGFHGLWIEFKSPKGTLSASQVQFANSMAPRGYKLVVARSYREALKAFCDYVGIEVK